MKYKATRTVLLSECPWLDEQINEGDSLYLFSGATYGCIGDGIAMTKSPDGRGTFFEVPRNAVVRLTTKED
jgi:hypothetical protein